MNERTNQQTNKQTVTFLANRFAVQSFEINFMDFVRQFVRLKIPNVF